MPQYRYIVANQENKRLVGVVNALDEDQARKELNNLSFSILSIEEIPEGNSAPKNDKVKFEFAGLDKKGKKVIGTIPAADRLQAYKKLTTEYNFQVLYVYEQNLTADEKDRYQLSGVADLENKLAEETKTEKLDTDQTHAKAKTAQEFSKGALAKQVEIVLAQAQKFLQEHPDKLVPQQKKEIEESINKILRIKTSNNLNYIRESCRELLVKLKDKRIFQEGKDTGDIQKKVNIDAKKLLIDINRENGPQPDLIFDLKSKLQGLDQTDENPSFWQKLFHPILKILSQYFEEEEKTSPLKKELKRINGQLFDYLKIWITANKEEKEEINKHLKELFAERKKIKMSLSQLKAEKRQIKAEKPKLNFHFLKELNSFTGWLLTFYLIYYFIANYFLTKNLGLNLSWNFRLFNSSFLKYLISFVFLFHSSTSLKITFFPQNKIANFLIFPTFFLIFILLLFNF